NKTLSDQLEQFIVEVINLLDKHQFKSLYRTLDGHMKSLVNNGDKNRKQSSLLEINKIKFILNLSAVAVDNPKALYKEFGSGIKDLYAEFEKSLIPPDIPGNAYTSYLTSKLRKELHDTMMKSICKDAKLDFK
ncbi:7272_t:CDS:2, partial [Racocetra fulgida]